MKLMGRLTLWQPVVLGSYSPLTAFMQLPTTYLYTIAARLIKTVLQISWY